MDPPPRARIAWLLACVALGVVAGLAVRAAGGGDAGFLAIPALVVAGWLRFADPTRCRPPDARPGADHGSDVDTKPRLQPPEPDEHVARGVADRAGGT